MSKEFHKIIRGDLRKLIFKHELNKLLSEESLIEMLRKFEYMLEKNYNSVSDFLNNGDQFNRGCRTFTIKHEFFIVRFIVNESGGYNLNVAYQRNNTERFSSIYLMNEFKRDPGYVYFIKSDLGWKIGKTKDISKRYKTFEVKLPFEFIIKHYVKTIDFDSLEIELHEMMSEKRINGEWFNLSSSDIEELRQYLRNRRYKLTDCNLKG